MRVQTGWDVDFVALHQNGSGPLSQQENCPRESELRAKVKRIMKIAEWMSLNLMIQNGSWHLAFVVDITKQQNTLSQKLQGPGQLIAAAYESVKDFSTKLR